MRVTLIQGGGMGLDQVPAVKRILEAAGVHIDWDEHLAGWASMERGGPPLPEAVLESVRENGVALKTKLLPPPTSAPQAQGRARNFNVQFRRVLGLLTSVRPREDLLGREIRVEKCCMQVGWRPQQFVVLAMGNLYGDLVRDLGAGVGGGVSATRGINVGPAGKGVGSLLCEAPSGPSRPKTPDPFSGGIHVYESFHR